MSNKIYPVRNNTSSLNGEANQSGEFSRKFKYSAGFSNGVYLIVFLVLIVGAIVFLVFWGAKNSQASPELVAFAKCLTDKGFAMYGTDSCSWCMKQKTDFKSAWQYIDYANCVKDPQRCVAANIEATPTWISNSLSKRIVGYQTFDKLSLESGCPMPSTN